MFTRARAQRMGVARRVPGMMGGSPNRDYEIMTVHISLARLHARFPRAKRPGSHAKRVFERAIYALTFRGYILFDTRDFSGDPL